MSGNSHLSFVVNYSHNLANLLQQLRFSLCVKWGVQLFVSHVGALFNNLLHSLASRVLKAFLRAYVEILVLAEPFTKQPVLIVDNNFKTDQVAFFRSGIWVLLKTVGRVHSMMWSKPYFQIHYALSIYFKILLLTDNYKRCRWWGAWRLCISVFIFEVRKLNSKIMGSKYLVTDMLYITGHWYSVNVHFEIGFSGSS